MQYECNRFFIAFGKKYRNIWRAYDALVGTDYNVEPYLENDTYKNLQGLKIDLDRDYESDFLKSLFDRFDHLTLLYSGGVDSHTIAVKARQHNLKFNQTITLVQNIALTSNNMDLNHVNDYVKNFFKDDSNYIIHNNSLEWIESVFENKEWWYTGGETNSAPITQVKMSPVYSEDTVYLAGHDKPLLFYHNGEWWVTAIHNMLSDVWSVPNILAFYGYNEFYPEILLSAALRMRNYYVEKFGNPEKTGFVNYKMHIGTPISDDFIKGINQSIGRYSVPGSRHEVDQAQLHPAISKRGLERMYELCAVGKETLAMQILRDCKNLYHKHPQIDWEFPPFEMKGKTPWFINLKTFEYVPGDQLQAIIGN